MNATREHILLTKHDNQNELHCIVSCDFSVATAAWSTGNEARAEMHRRRGE